MQSFNSKPKIYLRSRTFMNILFSAFINPERKSGVDKKIYGQIKAFKKLGHQVWYFTFRNNYIVLHHNDEEQALFTVQKNPIGYYLAIEKAVRQVATGKDRIKFDAIYIRRIFCTPFHLKTLKMLKEQGMVTVEEIPTYPYDNLNKNFKNPFYKAAARIDIWCRGGFKKYLDRFTTYTYDEVIFDVPALCLDNGIDFDNVNFIPTVFPEDRVDMIAVSAMAFWHGYERVIEGLAEYYAQSPEREVYFHLVGSGMEDAFYKELTAKYNLEKYVIFHGHMISDDLADVFKQCQIAFGSLGYYKANMALSSPLKNREYMAMGKPYIFGHEENDPNVPKSVSLQISNDATPVNINTVLDFYDNVRKIPDVSAMMHQYAKEHYGWDVQLKKVADFMENGLKK